MIEGWVMVFERGNYSSAIRAATMRKDIKGGGKTCFRRWHACRSNPGRAGRCHPGPEADYRQYQYVEGRSRSAGLALFVMGGFDWKRLSLSDAPSCLGIMPFGKG